nr:NADH dehydrogenase subunit 4L [Antarctophthirus carlinii]
MKSSLSIALLFLHFKLFNSQSMVQGIVILEWIGVTVFGILTLTALSEGCLSNFTVFYVTMLSCESVVGLSILVYISMSSNASKSSLLSCSKF